MFADQNPFNTDPDPAFRFTADPDPVFRYNADPDPAFHLNVDPDSDAAPHRNDANLRPLVYRP